MYTFRCTDFYDSFSSIFLTLMAITPSKIACTSARYPELKEVEINVSQTASPFPRRSRKSYFLFSPVNVQYLLWQGQRTPATYILTKTRATDCRENVNTNIYVFQSANQTIALNPKRIAMRGQNISALTIMGIRRHVFQYWSLLFSAWKKEARSDTLLRVSQCELLIDFIADN